MNHKLSIRRVYAVFETDAHGNEKVVATGDTKAEGEALLKAFAATRRAAEHEAEPKECPDGSGRLAPAGQHWVRNLMNGQWVLEANGTPYACSVASETYWSA